MDWSGATSRPGRKNRKLVVLALPYDWHDCVCKPLAFLDEVRDAAQELADAHNLFEPMIEVFPEEYSFSLYVTGYRELTDKEKAQKKAQAEKRAARDAEIKRQLKEQEIKEYQRLKEKYG